MKKQIKITLSVVGVLASIALLVISTILAEDNIINPIGAIALIVISVILVGVAIFYAAKVDCAMSVYECRNCGNTFEPAFKAYMWGAHTLKTRYLKCPECQKSSWCIRKKRNDTDV